VKMSCVGKRVITSAVAVILAVALVAPAYAQEPPTYTPEQLDNIVARVALYPDSLLVQILTASTYGDQIPDAAQWADEHHYLTGQELADAIQQDQLPYDPSVQALLPFPSVLDMMASDMAWTNDLGNAVLADRDAVMDAVQHQRHLAAQYGYLRTNGQVVVSSGPYITILPVNPAFIVVPAYNPGVVFFAPRPGFFVGGAIAFGFGITIGAWFHPWGWGVSHFAWNTHTIIINNVRWGRTWANRATYVHPYPGVHRYAAANRVEHHELVKRSPNERTAAREGHEVHEEHGGHDHHR
jgi:Protein of unknown function (DUF3300)